MKTLNRVETKKTTLGKPESHRDLIYSNKKKTFNENVSSNEKNLDVEDVLNECNDFQKTQAFDSKKSKNT